VRLLGIVVRLSPHHKPSRFALGRRSQAHATKKTTRIKRKTKPKARRRGAVPAKPLGIGCRFFRRAWLSFIGFCRSLRLLNLRFFGQEATVHRTVKGKHLVCQFAEVNGERKIVASE